MAAGAEMNLLELIDSGGHVTARYHRQRGPDGDWMRHGVYCGYHDNGNVATEGQYREGREEGVWRDYHDNGWIACVGHYQAGREQGLWRFFDREGNEQDPVLYRDGAVVQELCVLGACAPSITAS